MIKAQLSKGDGMGSRSWLRSVVRNVQRGLIEAGHGISADGRFGSGTQRAGRAFQRAAGVEPSGIVEGTTWRHLEPLVSRARSGLDAEEETWLTRFRGDLDWVHLQEGHACRPYWPEGASGITLDPGVDLGHASPELIEALYGSLLTKQQMRRLREVFGLKGQDARDALQRLPHLRTIRITRDQALRIMPYAARPYWDGIRKRFPAAERKDTPPSVQTVMLSLAYNRGIFNRGLEPLGPLLKDRDWVGIANKVGRMQQRHRQRGIRRRRREESSIIHAELELTGKT